MGNSDTQTMGIRAETSFSLKDDLFNHQSLSELSVRIAAARPGFGRAEFEKQVLSRFPELELKERINWIVTVLEAHLPGEYRRALSVLRKALPEALDPDRTDDDFGQFIWIVPGEYVAKHGCSEPHIGRSLAFLREATKRFSAEGAIRPFLKSFPDRTLAFVHECTQDDNYHVRRLASEGIRPLLPWAQRVSLDPAQIVEVLDRLHGDSTRYVTRSVANALNDISKQDPGIVISTLKGWWKAKKQNAAELQWMTRHALRTLVKRDHLPALELLGYSPKPAVRIAGLRSSTEVRVGENFECCFRLRSNARQKLLVSMRIFFLKANGRQAAKVFAVKNVELDKGEEIELTKKLPFKPVTTRVLYPGLHKAEIAVNGKVLAATEFELVAP